MGTQRHVQLNQALEKIVNTLVAKYRPEKIILFGSLAAGHVGEWSDINLAILKETTKPFIERSVEVAVLCLAPVGVDYLVYTPAEFAQMIQEGNPFIVNEIVNKGKILYSHTLSVGNSRQLTRRPSYTDVNLKSGVLPLPNPPRGEGTITSITKWDGNHYFVIEKPVPPPSRPGGTRVRRGLIYSAFHFDSSIVNFKQRLRWIWRRRF